MLDQVSSILFSLLVLRGISDSQGRMWRCHPDQHYLVEATTSKFTKELKDIPEYLTLCLLDMLPTVSCLSPCDALSRLKEGHSGM